MLFLLTGDVQIGKTRWLEALVGRLQELGAPVAGVLAPGQWVSAQGERADANGFEKQGIDNVLLPGGERIAFARRSDLARAEGVYEKGSQADRSQLVWHISDEAIARVNSHFDQLAHGASGRQPAMGKAEGGTLPSPGLLVVDELGRLELWAGEGLTSAVRLLALGPTPAFPHALVVVRDYLADKADQLLASAWEEVARISPDQRGWQQVVETFEGGAA